MQYDPVVLPHVIVKVLLHISSKGALILNRILFMKCWTIIFIHPSQSATVYLVGSDSFKIPLSTPLQKEMSSHSCTSVKGTGVVNFLGIINIFISG